MRFPVNYKNIISTFIFFLSRQEDEEFCSVFFSAIMEKIDARYQFSQVEILRLGALFRLRTIPSREKVWAEAGVIRHRKSRLKSNIDRSVNRPRAGASAASPAAPRVVFAACKLRCILPSGKACRDTVSAALRRATAGPGPSFRHRRLYSTLVARLARLQRPFRGVFRRVTHQRMRWVPRVARAPPSKRYVRRVRSTSHPPETRLRNSRTRAKPSSARRSRQIIYTTPPSRMVLVPLAYGTTSSYTLYSDTAASGSA